jgi:4-amino-4-deoxy-L-arabinose transferase-like glycosyltransferase
MRAASLLVAIVLALAGISAFAGSGDQLPLDTHDVMVALTTQEMIQRDAYLVPYINDEPRLKKPPMNYWAVMTVDKAHGNDGRISPWEARVPSAAAAVVLAGVTLALGVLLVNWEVGLLAALLVTSCRGFIGFSHSSRPEMLYSAFCVLAMLGFVLSDQWEREARSASRAKWAAYLAWLMMGFASLTKGPQLPLAIIIGQVVGMWATGERGRIMRVLRPMVGFPIMAAVSLWWVVAVVNAVPDAWKMWEGEVQGRTGRGNDPLYRFFYPYYLYSPVILMLPWVAFLPLMWAAPWLGKLAPRTPMQSDESRVKLKKLWWWVVCAALILSCVWGRREYYMLPMLPAMMILAAYGALWLAAMLTRNGLAWAWRAAMMVLTLGAGGFVFYLSRYGAPEHRPDTPMVIGAAVACLFAAVHGMRKEQRGGGALRLAAVTWIICMAIGSYSGAQWGLNRYRRDEFANAINNDIGPAGKLFGWKEQWYLEAYRTNRLVPVVKDADDLREQVEANGPIYVLFRPKKRPIQLPPSFTGSSVRRLESVTSSDDEDDSDPLEVWRVEAAGATTMP